MIYLFVLIHLHFFKDCIYYINWIKADIPRKEDKTKSKFLFVAIVALTAAPLVLNAQVLGLCGSSAENEPNAAMEAKAPAIAPQVQHVLRPGDRAVNFELTAVVGDEIKKVKLSDYNGQWRVVCFFPAAFTFV